MVNRDDFINVVCQKCGVKFKEQIARLQNVPMFTCRLRGAERSLSVTCTNSTYLSAKRRRTIWRISGLMKSRDSARFRPSSASRLVGRFMKSPVLGLIQLAKRRVVSSLENEGGNRCQRSTSPIISLRVGRPL